MASTRDFIVKNGLVVLGQGSTQATSTNTGALVVQGGAGILGNVIIGGTSSSTNTSSGAVQVQGGVGIGGDLYARNIYSNNFQVLTSATIGTYGVSAIFAGTDTAVSASTGSVVIWNTSTLQSITNRSATTTNIVSFTNTSNAVSTTSGALQVAGGAGIGQDLWVGGKMSIGGSSANAALTVQSAGVAGWVAGLRNVIYLKNTNASGNQSNGIVFGSPTFPQAWLIHNDTLANGTTVHQLTFSNSGTTRLTIDSNGYLLPGADGTYDLGSTSTRWRNSYFSGTITSTAQIITGTTDSTSTTTGALRVTGGVGVQGDLYASGVYDQNARVWTTATLTNLNQLSNTTTQYLTSSTLGQYGVSSIQAGTGIAVSNPAGIVTITNVGVVSLTGTPYIGISAASGSNISITNLGVQSLTAGADISVSGSTGTITVSGTGTFQTVTNRGSTTTNAIRVANTTSVNSTNTGALQVQGGVGIGGGLFVGGTITATNLTIGGFPVSTSSVITASYFGSPLGQFTNLNFTTGTTATVTAGTVTVQSIGASVTVSDTPPLSPSGGNLWWDSTVGVLRVYYVDPNSSEWVDAFPVMVGPQGPAGTAGTFSATTALAVSFLNATASTSTNTGALTVGGGVGIGGDLYVGGTIVANQLTIQYTTVTTNLVTTDDIIITTNNTSATSTTTGALRIAGGAGIGGALYVGATSYVAGAQIITTATIGSFAVTSSGYATTSSLAAYATTASLAAYATTASLAAYATTSSIATSAAYATTSSLSAYATTSSIATSAAYATTSSLSAYATTSSIATSAAYATTSSIATSAAYATTSSIATSAAYATTASLASYATTSSIATSAAYATTSSLASYATTSSIASTATSAAVAYSIVNTSTLQVGFAVNQAGGSVNATTGQFSGITTITNVTASTTTATGALQVAGGVGIGKNINVGPGATNRSIGNANAYGNMFAAAGDSQYVNYILGIKTTTNAATGLTTDHNTAGAANQIILPNSSAYGFKAYVTARDSVNQWMGVWEISGGIRRGATAASTTLVGTPVVTRIAYDTTATTWAATVAADTTNGGLQVRVTGTGTTNITWVANVLTIEVA